MDKAERDDLREHMATVARIYEPGFCPRISQHEILALLAAADERDAARAEAARYRKALLAIEDTIENARFELRSGHVFDTDEFILGSVRAALAAADMASVVTTAKEER